MSSKQVKIGIETSCDESDDIEVEFPWADDLGNNKYQIKNFPFFAYGVSFDDIVEAQIKYDDDPYPYFVRVIEKSGHKTLRVILDESIKESECSRQQLKNISDMGCGYEGTNGEKYFVVNVQPHCDFDAVKEYLNDQRIQWEYADPTYDQIHEENT